MELFRSCALTRVAFGPALAISVARSGGVGLLDLSEFPEAPPADSSTHLQRLVGQTSPEHSIGVRIAAGSVSDHGLLDCLEGRNHWVILADWNPALLDKLNETLPCPGRTIWLELKNPEETSMAAGASMEFHGWVARGSETGGPVGSASAFFMAQALARQEKPFLVQGGLGLHTAAACRVAGAAGVIFDDQLAMLPESALRADWKERLGSISSEDTVVIGRELGMGVRIPARAGHPAGRRLAEWAEAIAAGTPRGERLEPWEAGVSGSLGWGSPERFAWPVGQGVGLARRYAERYKTAGRLVHAVRASVEESVELARSAPPLARGGALAGSHGTEFPIVQCPMTGVSDHAEFARKVAEAGALPVLALGLLKKAEVESLLSETRTAVEGRPWGVGMLAFVPAEVREAQLEAILAERPPFAFLSGVRPDQAARLEEAGIATYLHAPSPSLLRNFLAQGGRRFVFEGSECGGHVGPLTSFSLWEQAIGILLDEVPWSEAGRIHVLFAGGIHDALSAAMVSAMAAPLAARGIRIGVSMGTAYLFTGEAVGSGAIVEAFQEHALQCRKTVTLETGLGRSIRCAASPFQEEFESQLDLLRSRGLAAAEVAETLESLVLERARIASKGTRRGKEGRLEPLDAPDQQQLGMYMMGEAATLRHETVAARDLHEDVSEGATRVLASVASAGPVANTEQPTAAPIAIVGFSCILPGAESPDVYWRNLLDKRNAISEIPSHRFDWRLFFDPDPTAPDRIYSKWGGFLEEMEFDPLSFGIPPNSLKSISTTQLLCLEAARRAIADAGYGAGDFDRENTAVVLGAASTSDLFHFYVARSTYPVFTPDGSMEISGRLPAWNEESFPGVLTNVTAGRVANRLDLGGPNFTVDAACASSLAALELGMRELETGRSNLAIVGGVDTDQTPYSYMAFSKARALSPRGKAAPFDCNADGIVIGEGVVVLVLKRLADAERDGDRIYAAIRSCEGSSDGKGIGLTAPQPSGQRLALKRAYSRAGVSPATLGLYEAHGTGAAAGDRAELEAIGSTLIESGAGAGECVIGSAKSLIGHTKAAAGLAGVLKAALALYHRTLPPHSGVEQPLDAFCKLGFPLRLLDTPQPWLPAPHPRRAGVSAFGFGGANFHAVLEEYGGHLREPALGAEIWPAELFCFAGRDADETASEIEMLRDRLNRVLGTSAEPLLRDLAFAAALRARSAAAAIRVAFVAVHCVDLARLLDASLRSLKQPGAAIPTGISIGLEPASTGEVAFLFPGLGSEYPGMGEEQSLYLREFRREFESSPVRGWLLGAATLSAEAQQALAAGLAAPDVAQPTIGAVSCAMHDLARRLGLKAARVAGHGYGEFTALHAAGVFDRAEFQRISSIRGQAMARAAELAEGTMAAVYASPDEVRAVLSEFPGVTLAHLNSPCQCAISGRREDVEAVCGELAAKQIRVTPLPACSAFHSPLIRPAVELLNEAIAAAKLGSPVLPVHSNRDGSCYPEDEDAIREQLSSHLESPIDFMAQIRAIYGAGARVFVELGPGTILTGMTSAILEGQPHLAVSFDGQSGGLRATLTALAKLFAHGVSLDLPALFADRNANAADADAAQPHVPSEWLIDGGRVRRRNEEPGLVGQKPLLNLETARQALDLISQTAVNGNGSHANALAAYEAYQETMRRFIQSQEQIMMQLLGVPGEASNGSAARAALPAPAPSLKHEVPLIERLREAPAPAPESNPAPAAVGSTSSPEFKNDRRRTASASVPRFVIRDAAEPAPAEAATLRGLFLVTEDGLGVAPILVHALRGLGAAAVTIGRDALVSADNLRQAVMRARAVHGPIHGLVHLAALTPGASIESIGDWRRETALQTKSLFEMLRLCLSDFERQDAVGAVALAATVTGGLWGRGRSASGIERVPGCGVHGILATLHAELPRVMAKVVDLDPASPADLMAAQIAAEVHPAGRPEVGYPAQRRTIFRCQPEEVDRNAEARDWKPGDGWVVLVTGGARGITARIARQLAGPGVRLILVGRGEMPSDVSGPPEGLRAQLAADVRANSSMLNLSENDAQRGRERSENIAALRALGAEVEYHAVDVSNEERFGALIDGIYSRFGRLDAVVHGAGVIDDKLLGAKTRDAFDRVFAAKADGTFLLSRHLRPEGLKWVVLFGSVSGRFGNPGQCDYAAGNEVMNRLAWEMAARWTDTRVVSINWGPWEGSGMAGGKVARLLVARRISMLDPDSACRFFADELAFGSGGDVEIVAGAGPWARAAESKAELPVIESAVASEA